MAKRNINSIQNPTDLNMDEYILQSLANLGQRMGIQGDGVAFNTFQFGDLINTGEYSDPVRYIGIIRKASDKIAFSVIDKSTMLDMVQPVEIYNTDGYVITSECTSLERGINGIDEYASGGIIRLDKDGYTIAFKGISNGSVLEFVCERYDRSDNMTYGVRIRKFGAINEERIGMCIQYIENGTVKNKWYECLNADTTVDDIANILLNTYGKDIVPETVVGVALNLNFMPVALEQVKNISKYIQFFTYDSTYLYRYMKKYRSEVTFNSDNVQLRKQLLVALFNMIIENSTIATEIYVPLDYVFNYAYNTNNEWEIYYNSTAVVVKYMSDDIDSHMLMSSANASGIICYTDKQERVSLYNYSVEYNDGNNPNYVNVEKYFTMPYVNGEGYWVINDVDTTVYAKGQDAGNPNIIIVESHKNVADHVVVSGAHKDTILENNMLHWTQKTAYTEPIEKINIEDISVMTLFDYFKVNVTVPDMKEIPTYYKDEWYKVLENSIIINIADIDCIDYSNNINYKKEDVIARYGVHGNITTIWTLDPKTKEFEYLKKQGNSICAADFNYIANTSNLIKWHLENHVPKSPDHYQFTYLVFDAAYVALKNNTSDTRTYIYPNITNRTSVLYNTPNYNNEFNLTIKYNDFAEGGIADNISDVSQSSDTHYFDTTYTNGTSLSANVVTNSLYTYLNGVKRYKMEEYIPNYNVPTLDLGEVLTRNETLINRLNILSFNKYGATYLSYIGTSYQMDKNILVIGTTDTNINMGTETLINENERNKFNKQNEVHVDFDTTKISGKLVAEQNVEIHGDIEAHGTHWRRLDTKISNTLTNTRWVAQYAPTGRFLYEINDNYYSINNAYAGLVTLNSDTNNMFYTTSNAVYNYAKDKEKLFVICTIPQVYYNTDGTNAGTHHIYIGDGIYIPTLLNQIGLGNHVSVHGSTITLSNISIESNMDIYSHNGVPTVLQSTSMLLSPNKYKYVKTPDGIYADSISDFTNEMFTTNILNISYTISKGNVLLTINEDKPDNRMIYMKKIKKEY